MLPIYLALFAYLINALVFLVDKYLLSAPIPRPLAYAFWVSVLSLFALFLIPFGVTMPSAEYLIIAFVSGAAMFLGLIFLYESIMAGDISVASAKVGAFSAITAYVLSFFILPDSAHELNILAASLLIGGIFLLSRTHGKVVLQYTMVAGFFSGISVVFLKWTFNEGDFIDGVFWTRMFFVGTALITILSKDARAQIKKFLTHSPQKSQHLFFLNKALAAIGFFILYYAINVGSVATIQSLLGFQFVFVFVIALAMKAHFPKLEQKISKTDLSFKIAGITLVFIGFALSFV